jgi:transcription elongation factor GreA-like protein
MKFLYIADTHIGGSDTKGYTQQERYLKHFDESSLKNVVEAGRLFNKLPCPVYFTPGNYNFKKTYVQGRTCDRSFKEALI